MTTSPLTDFEWTTGPVDTAAVRSSIIETGYAIVKDVVPVQLIQDLRDFWLGAFRDRASKAPAIWGPHLGEENRILFHQSGFDCLYRAYDFLWNPPIHDNTRKLGVELNRLRNAIAEFDPLAGETYVADGYGVYVTVSYYPPGEGWLRKHEDQTDMRRHWHFILPLTFKDRDFSGGGLYLIDRGGNRIDVDDTFEPGSVLFFDGELTHGVDQIELSETTHLGRMQMFAIPTFIERPSENDRMVEAISIGRFIKAKLRPFKHRITGLRSPAPSAKHFS